MKEEKTHESYGMLTFSRFSGNGSEFYGSDLKHSGGVTLRIATGGVKRDLSSNWYYANKNLIEVKMSYNQFVDAITAGMNTEGVPCTLTYFNGTQIPQISHVEDKREVFAQEMNETSKEYLNKIDALTEMLDGNLGKKKIEEIKHGLSILKSHIKDNNHFVERQFRKSMDKAVNEAKHSIANYIDNKIHSTGLEVLRNDLQIGMKEE